jgi:hypothetical protein
MSLAKKIGVITLMMLGVLSLAIVFLMTFFDYSTPKRNRYLIPSGYAGWLCVKYGVKGAPALQMEEEFRLVRFPLTGYVETSSEVMTGSMKDDFFYVGNGGRSLVDMAIEMGGGSTTGYPTGEHIHKFWVSRNAKADYRHYVESRSEDCGPFEGYKGSAAFNSSLRADASRH